MDQFPIPLEISQSNATAKNQTQAQSPELQLAVSESKIAHTIKRRIGINVIASENADKLHEFVA